MPHVLGPKGQIVIEKRIREELGLEPGWKALQRVVDGRVELHFVPPTHNRSLFGILAKYARVPAPSDEEMDAAIERAIGEEWAEEDARLRAAETERKARSDHA